MISEETLSRLVNATKNLASTIYNLLGHVERNPAIDDLRLLRNLALNLPDHVAKRYHDELLFLESASLSEPLNFIIPYHAKRRSNIQKCVSAMESGLPYVLHGSNKLFFPSDMTPDAALACYKNYIDVEGLLGEGICAKSPHCYVAENFTVEKDDVVLDVGCAEALFALDNIDVVKEAYLFECMKKWRKPLARTFAPYKHKTHLIPKFVSGHTDSKSIRLVDALPPCGNATYFIKMDIEGNERFVLESSRDFLKANKVKLACCVYHRQDDADYVSKLLTGLGYSVSFSDGYMLPTLNGIHFPYFRKGVIRAKNF